MNALSGAADDGLTPLDAMLAAIRWAHEAAEATRTQMAALVGKDAVIAAKVGLTLRNS